MPTWKKIRRSVPFTTTVTILCGIAATLISTWILSEEGKRVIKEYALPLTDYYSYFVIAVFFLLAVSQWYIGYRFGKKRVANLTEEKAENDIAALKIEHEKRVGSLIEAKRVLYDEITQEYNDKHEAFITAFKSDSSIEATNLRNGQQLSLEIIEKHENTLNQNAWLIDLADKQTKNICDYVKLDKFFISHIKEKPLPYIVFLFEMKNNSLFDVTLENSIGGHMEFSGTTLEGSRTFTQEPHAFDCNKPGWFAFEYRLSPAEFTMISEYDGYDKDDYVYNVSGLIFTIKGTEKSPQIISNPVKIRHDFRVWDYKEYEQAQDKFQQPEN